MRLHPLQSSSTKLALFFSGLLGLAAVLIVFEMVAIARGGIFHPMLPQLVLILLFFVCVCLFVIGLHVTQRMNAIAETASQITRTADLSRRIAVEGKGTDDISRLSLVLNSMLDEIEQLVKGMRTLSDNIAHDLRHPLTRLRNHIDQMRKSTGEESELHQELSALMSECDALLTTFQALLRISNIESGKRHSGFKFVDIERLLQDVVDLYEPVAADKSISFSFAPCPLSVMGDKDLLFQAFTNLVDNAIKYTPTGGSIDLAMRLDESGPRIVLKDSGLGVSDEHKQQVFRRFYRIENSRRAPGSGLGLSLVAAIIKLHKGMIQLHDNTPSGLIVTVTL